MLQLPSIPKLQDVQWERVTEQWVKLTANTKKIADGAGQSQEFKALEEGVRRLVLQSDFEQVKKILRKRRGVRVLTQLWIDNDEVRKNSFNESFISFIQEQHPKLGMSSLMNLISLLYRYFDDLNIGSAFHKLTSWLTQQIDMRLKDRKRNNDTILTVLHQHKSWLFDVTAPKAVVDLAKKNHLDLNDQLKQLRLSELPQGRFLNICHAQYYLETLRNIPLGEDHEILSELSKTEVAGMPFEDGKRIGHIALEIIIDRSGGAPSSVWQNFVLDLAGDPRIASTAKNYREWWMPIGENRIKTVTSWLAKEDLRLFLQTLKEYSLNSNQHELRAMFPAREKFLTGLYNSGLIKNARLILSSRAKDYLKGSLESIRIDNVANLKGDPHSAVIYLDCGDFFIIEGSHSFALQIYLSQPSFDFYDYGCSIFTKSSISTKYFDKYKKMHGDDKCLKIRHQGEWVYKAIGFIFENSKNVSLEVLEKVLSKKDYLLYLSRYGVPSFNVSVLESSSYSIVEEDEYKSKSKSEDEIVFESEFGFLKDLSSSKNINKKTTSIDDFESLFVNGVDISKLSFEGKVILNKVQELGACNLYVLRTSLGVTANHCLNYIRGELAPYIEKDFKQMYRLKEK